MEGRRRTYTVARFRRGKNEGREGMIELRERDREGIFRGGKQIASIIPTYTSGYKHRYGFSSVLLSTVGSWKEGTKGRGNDYLRKRKVGRKFLRGDRQLPPSFMHNMGKHPFRREIPSTEGLDKYIEYKWCSRWPAK